MKLFITLLKAVWLIFSAMSFCFIINGGEPGVVGTLMFFILTAPIGMAWEYKIYESLSEGYQTVTIYVIGIAISFLLTYLLYFIVLPWSSKVHRR